ncbi:MAG: hypothetical protein U5K55_14385 [Aliarcobacter sp.]|nr:hypothetical protein [Aliarcobacter sp.]
MATSISVPPKSIRLGEISNERFKIFALFISKSILVSFFNKLIITCFLSSYSSLINRVFSLSYSKNSFSYISIKDSSI